MPESGDYETQVDPKTVAEIKSLNAELIEPSELGPMFDGFVNMYGSLPEFPFSQIGKTNLKVEWSGGNKDWNVTPVASYCGKLIVRDIIEPSTNRAKPAYRMLRGSIFLSDTDMNQRKLEEARQIIPSIVTADKQSIGAYEVDKTRINVAFSPDSFCKDSLLTYSRVFTLGALKTSRLRARSAAGPMHGKIITVHPHTNRPQTLFVEDDIVVKGPLKNVKWQVGGEYYPLLSYIIKDAQD